MAKTFLDEAGLATLWNLINTTFESKADLVEELADYVTNENLENSVDAAVAEAMKNMPTALEYGGIVESLDEVEEPKAGLVVLIGDSEYIYNGEEWELFGDAIAHDEPNAITEEKIKEICV